MHACIYLCICIDYTHHDIQTCSVARVSAPFASPHSPVTHWAVNDWWSRRWTALLSPRWLHLQKVGNKCLVWTTTGRSIYILLSLLLLLLLLFLFLLLSLLLLYIYIYYDYKIKRYNKIAIYNKITDNTNRTIRKCQQQILEVKKSMINLNAVHVAGFRMPRETNCLKHCKRQTNM